MSDGTSESSEPAEILPMFPLGTVLLPGAVLPLHVFEARYRALVEHCLAGDRRFGVVLIERGSEVGGGDTRFAVGAVAHLLEASRFPDGRYAVVAVGGERLEVRRWLPDDPYPRAEVVVTAEPAPSDDAPARLDDVQRELRRVLALAAELGLDVAGAAAALRPSDDIVAATYTAIAAAPLGPLDRQRLLELAHTDERLASLAPLLAEEAAVIEERLRDPH